MIFKLLIILYSFYSEDLKENILNSQFQKRNDIILYILIIFC